MSKHRTEQVYDDEMAPLVARLIEISKREGIPLLVNAGMLDANGEPLQCITLLGRGPEGDDRLAGIDNRHGLCDGILRGDERFDRAAGLVITRFHSEVLRG